MLHTFNPNTRQRQVNLCEREAILVNKVSQDSQVYTEKLYLGAGAVIASVVELIFNS